MTASKTGKHCAQRGEILIRLYTHSGYKRRGVAASFQGFLLELSSQWKKKKFPGRGNIFLLLDVIMTLVFIGIRKKLPPSLNLNLLLVPGRKLT